MQGTFTLVITLQVSLLPVVWRDDESHQDWIKLDDERGDFDKF